MTSIHLPENMQTWVENSLNGKITRAEKPKAGASREAWLIDVETSSKPAELFLLRDKGGGEGSKKDAAVLKAIGRSSEIPVPHVVSYSEEMSAILLERVSGNSDYTDLAEGEQKESIANDLMRIAAELHAIAPKSLNIPHLTMPRDTDECITQHLETLRGALPALGEEIDPYFEFAIGWLDRNRPENSDRMALVHSDLGPDNFIFAGNRIAALLDWEVAHFGDPMEDLATIAIRDMATPFGDLKKRYAEYREYSTNGIDLETVAYYRILILTRNSLFITLGLKFPTPDFDVLEMLAYQAMLMRAGSLCLLEYEGLLDDHSACHIEALSAVNKEVLVEGIHSALDRAQPNESLSPYQSRQRFRIAGALNDLERKISLNPAWKATELDSINKLLGSTHQDLGEARSDLGAFATNAHQNRSRERDLMHCLNTRMKIIAEQRKNLMGVLYTATPQRLLDRNKGED